MKKLFYFFALFLFLFINNQVSANYYKRIISISPVVTEIIYALKAEDRLVGVTSACNYPQAAKLKPIIGDFMHPNLEKIVTLKPDLVIGMGNKMAPGAIKLKDLKIQNQILDSPEKINEIYNLILEIGTYVEKEKNAEILVATLKKEIAISRKKKDVLKPKVLFIIWSPPIMAAGKNTFIDEMITLAGGENIIKSKLQFPPISEETIIYSNPDIIIVTEKKLKKLIKKNTAIRNTAAFKNNRIIYSIDPDIVSRPGPRFVQGIEALKNVFF